MIQPLELAAGDEATVEVTLHRVLDTEGMLSADFHNHAAAGPDLVLTDEERLYNLAAEGVEVRAETNHARVTDLSSLAADHGLDPWLASIPSQEITTFDYGHFSTFPMERDPAAANGGAFDWEGWAPPEIFDWAAGSDHPQVIHVYHPRAIPTPFEAQNYFTVLDLVYGPGGPSIGPHAYDPMATAVPDDAVMFGPGFTAMEVMTWMNVQGLSDWFNLLSAGYAITATANSDTHTLRVESSGWPRNFVQVGLDDPTVMDVDALVAAVNEHRSSGSFGPLVTLEAETVDGAAWAAQGEMLSTAGGVVRVLARVQAAPWVPVDTLDVYADGELIHSEALALEEVGGAEGGTRLEQTVEVYVETEEDTYVAAVVYGTGSLFPYLTYNCSDPDTLTLEALRAGAVDEPATPFGFANPIFLDADDDGLITPSFHVMPLDVDEYRWEDRLSPY
ncbi:MAG: CehA/McbA family metallohydrolase [Pseudomonadota bacterium]